MGDDEWVSISDWTYHYSGITSTKELLEFQDLEIFPNPASSIINLGGDVLGTENNVVQIFNSEGAIISSGMRNDSQINIEHLPSGLYHIILNAKTRKSVGRFLKI